MRTPNVSLSNLYTKAMKVLSKANVPHNTYLTTVDPKSLSGITEFDRIILHNAQYALKEASKKVK